MFSSNGGGKRPPSRDGFDVFVGNLPEATTEDQMRQFFQKHGEVISVTLRQNYGFVRFATEEQYMQALSCNYCEFLGSKITVKKGNKKSGKRNKDESVQSYSGNKPDLVSNHQALPQGNPNKPVFNIERRENLVVSHVETPVTFFAQNVANSDTISDITMKLQSLCASVYPSPVRPVRDKVYASKFSEDDNWYRCKVREFHSPSQVDVLYIDYGNSEVREDADLVELPPGLQQPHPQASRYTLYGLNPCHPDPTTSGFEQGHKFLKSLVEQKIIFADVISCDSSTPCIPVILYADKLDVNQLMLDNGHAEKRPVNRPQGGSAPGSYPARLPDAQLNRQGQSKSKFTSTMRSSHKPPPKLMEGAIGNWESAGSHLGGGQGAPMWLATKGANDLGSGDPSAGNVESLKAQLAQAKTRLSESSAQAEKQRIKHQQEIDRLTRENKQLQEQRNSSTLELATTKGALKTAESAVTQLSHDAERNNFALKLRMLLRDMGRVRALRSQFPTEDSRDDFIENALMLLIQDDPLKGSNIMGFAEDVDTSLGSFNIIQDRIRSAKSVEEVSDILEARDDARCQLHKKTEEFLEAVEKFPIENATHEFKVMIQCLEQTYEAYMRGPFDESCLLTLEEIDSKWAKWKAKNSQVVQEVRTEVNTYHNKVDSVLTHLQEQLRLSCEHVTDLNTSACLTLPACITDLQSALIKEIAMTDLDDKQDTSLEIRAIVRSLVQSCAARLEQLGILNTYKIQYESLKNKLTPWLRNKPDLQEVQSVRKGIRACNSKLRHRLADKLDLEEADDSSPEEIKEVKDSITQLRNELQEALAKQDDLVSNIQEVILNQFPELALEYADLGIQTCSEYSGLVKGGRSLDHFDLQLIDETRKGVYKSTFRGKPIILKEYLLDDSVGVSKTEFLRRVKSYHNVQNQNLLPLQAVFFTKNERQVVIQVPRYEQTLVKKVESGDLDIELVQSLLKNILEGVSALHSNGIIHGYINPLNIFLTDDGKAVLNCVDFMKSAEQRALSGNPQFVAPELIAGAPATFKCDVFSLGVLTYWLNFPHAEPGSEWPAEAKDTPLQQLVVQATEKSPSDRPDALELLTFPFFKTRMSVSKDTLQLRMKSTCMKSEGRGILKNSSPGKEQPPPDVIKTDSSGEIEDLVSNGDEEEELSSQDDSDTNCDTNCEEDDVILTPESGVHSIDGEDDAKKNKHSNKLASIVMFHNEGTPTLPCTPMDTPSNTPIESENNTPAKHHGSELHSAVVQASLETLLTKKDEDGTDDNEADVNEDSEDDGESMPALEDGTTVNEEE